MTTSVPAGMLASSSSLMLFEPAPALDYSVEPHVREDVDMALGVCFS